MPPRVAVLSSLHRPICLHGSLSPGATLFHTSVPRRDEHIDNSTNHYETLNLQPNATAADIKRQFYSLSKKHHPDHNSSDPTASSRFVKISEAYHVLGSVEKRASYDRDLLESRQTGHGHHAHSHGSHFGSRPASGLSRRRTQFRGPPPSFYRSGGWGNQSAKRAANASFSHEHPGEYRDANTNPGGGFGPSSAGFASSYSDSGIPHWDRVRHQRTQDNVSQHTSRHRRARSADAEPTEAELLAKGAPSLLGGFIIVSGVLGLVLIITGVVLGASSEGRKEKKKSREGSAAASS